MFLGCFLLLPHFLLLTVYVWPYKKALEQLVRKCYRLKTEQSTHKNFGSGLEVIDGVMTCFCLLEFRYFLYCFIMFTMDFWPSS